MNLATPNQPDVLLFSIAVGARRSQWHEATRRWMGQCDTCRRKPVVGCDDAPWLSRHPLLVSVNGFAAANAKLGEDSVTLSAPVLSIGDETHVTTLAAQALHHVACPSVSYDGRGSDFSLLMARARLLGSPTHTILTGCAKRHVDLAESVAPPPSTLYPPLPVVIHELELGSYRSTLAPSEVEADLRAGRHRRVAAELLWRLESVGRLLALIRAGERLPISWRDGPPRFDGAQIDSAA